MTTTVPNPDSVTIRQVERADLLDVVRIEKAAFPQPWPYAAFERYLEEPGFLVATEGLTVVGYVVADSVPNHGRDIGHVKDIAVSADHRGRGIGRRLLDRSLSVLDASGVTHVKLEVRETNEAAIDLYRQFGFEPHHIVRRYYDDGEDAVVYVADLRD